MCCCCPTMQAYCLFRQTHTHAYLQQLPCCWGLLPDIAQPLLVNQDWPLKLLLASCLLSAVGVSAAPSRWRVVLREAPHSDNPGVCVALLGVWGWLVSHTGM